MQAWIHKPGISHTDLRESSLGWPLHLRRNHHQSWGHFHTYTPEMMRLGSCVRSHRRTLHGRTWLPARCRRRPPRPGRPQAARPAAISGRFRQLPALPKTDLRRLLIVARPYSTDLQSVVTGIEGRPVFQRVYSVFATLQPLFPSFFRSFCRAADGGGAWGRGSRCDGATGVRVAPLNAPR